MDMKFIFDGWSQGTIERRQFLLDFLGQILSLNQISANITKLVLSQFHNTLKKAFHAGDTDQQQGSYFRTIQSLSLTPVLLCSMHARE